MCQQPFEEQAAALFWGFDHEKPLAAEFGGSASPDLPLRQGETSGSGQEGALKCPDPTWEQLVLLLPCELLTMK